MYIFNPGPFVYCYVSLPECNSQVAPENGYLEYFFVSFWGPAYFHELLLVVLGSVCTHT